MSRRRQVKTKKNPNETVSVFYGINPKTLEVDTVYVTREGKLSRYSKTAGQHIHHNSHGTTPAQEIVIVYGLLDLFQTHPTFDDNAHTKEKIAELEQKAAAMRAERDANKASEPNED